MRYRRIIFFLLFYCGLTVIWLLYDRRYLFITHTLSDIFSDIIQLPAIWVFPIVTYIIGLLFSKLSPFIFKNRTGTYHFFVGQLMILILTATFFLIALFNDLSYEKKFGNIEFNRLNRSNTFFPIDSTHQSKAFDALESNFVDKNSFRLTDLFSDNKDSIVNNTPTQIHICWFSYFKVEDPKKVLCAKYRVYNDTLIADYFNSNAETNSDFIKRKGYKDSLMRIVNHH
jgi:cell division protein FtsL